MVRPFLDVALLVAMLVVLAAMVGVVGYLSVS